MARDFAAAYKNLAWEAIFCSPMDRTMATAEPLCKALGITPQLRDGLKEIAYGCWEGKTPDEVNREFHDEYVAGWPIPAGIAHRRGKGGGHLPPQFRGVGRDRTDAITRAMCW